MNLLCQQPPTQLIVTLLIQNDHSNWVLSLHFLRSRHGRGYSVGFAKGAACRTIKACRSSMLEIFSHKFSYVTSMLQKLWKKHSDDALTGLYLVNWLSLCGACAASWLFFINTWLASFPGARKIWGSAWYTMFAHARLPWRTWKLLNTSPCCRSYIIGSLEPSHVMAVSSKLRSTKPYCTPSVRSESQEWCWRMNKRWHTLAAHRLSSPWIVNNQLACLASTSERQKRHSKVVAIARVPDTRASCIFTEYSPRYYLQAQLTYHDKFYGKYYGIHRACANHVPCAPAPGTRSLVLQEIRLLGNIIAALIYLEARACFSIHSGIQFDRSRKSSSASI